MAAAAAKIPKKYRDPEDFNLRNIEEKSELGSVWIFNRCLVDNIRYDSVADIKNDKKYYELESIWEGAVPSAWLESYFKQQKTMLHKFSSIQWEEFEYGKGSFIDFIKEVLSRVHYNNKKINYVKWNPADIWMIQKNKKNEIKKFINENIKSNAGRSQTLAEFNDLLKNLITKKELIGVSLKKIGSGEAKFIFVNVKVDGFETELKDENNEIEKIEYNLDTLSSTIKFKNKNKIQITLNNTSSFSNLKFESLVTGSGGRGGKVVLDNLVDLMKDNQISFDNNYKLYPQTRSKFVQESEEYEKIYKKLLENGIISRSISYDEVVDSILNFYEKGNHQGVCKLMQLKFFESITNITNEKKKQEFITDMFYLGIKLGDKFAPHGKLY